MLDVHTIAMPHTPSAWVAQCLDSVATAAALSPYPVAIHRVSGEVGHVGRSRAAGYAEGNAPYVTYVDEDDFITPEAFSALADALSTSPAAIFPAEMQLQNGKFLPGPQRHHLCVYRREHLIDHTQWTVCGDLAQMNAVREKPCIEVSDRVYVHRIYQSEGRILRRSHHDELRRARG